MGGLSDTELIEVVGGKDANGDIPSDDNAEVGEDENFANNDSADADNCSGVLFP